MSEVVLLDVSDDAITVSSVRQLPESPYRGVDPNARGGTRGLHGVAVAGDEVLVTDYNGITVLDRSLETISRIENRLFAGLHEIACVGDQWWVVSTLADAVLRVDRSGDVTGMWRPAESQVLATMLGLPDTTPLDEVDSDPRTMAGRLHNLSHLNSLASHGTDLFVSLGLVVIDRSCHESGALPGPDRADS